MASRWVSSSRIRRARVRVRLATLLELSSYSIGFLYIAFLILLLAGIAAGIVGGWWTNGRLWLWTALVVLVVVVGVMYGLMTTTYLKVRQALGIPSPSDTKKGMKCLQARLGRGAGGIAHLVTPDDRGRPRHRRPARHHLADGGEAVLRNDRLTAVGPPAVRPPAGKPERKPGARR